MLAIVAEVAPLAAARACARAPADATRCRPRGLSGRAVAKLPEVPPHLRGQIISAIHVLCRLRGERPTLETPEQLRAYLEGCGGLLTKLGEELRESKP